MCVAAQGLGSFMDVQMLDFCTSNMFGDAIAQLHIIQIVMNLPLIRTFGNLASQMSQESSCSSHGGC